MKAIYIIVGVAALAAWPVLAQQEQGVTYRLQTGAGGIAVAGFAKFGLMGQPVKGAPYSAHGTVESTQTLGDGTHINRQESYTIFRDGEGRVRRESGDQVWISDPVANTTYVLDTTRQTARKLMLKGVPEHAKVLAPKLSDGPPPADVIYFSTGGMDAGAPGGPVHVYAQKIKARDMAAIHTPGDAGPVTIAADNGKTESLGRQEMEGVQVDGTRTTNVIPQGQIGNDRPLEMVHERWESSELHITVLAKHSDPMMGERVERLTSIGRNEPDPALFQVPAGYKIEPEN